MQWTNTSNGYGSTAIALHWLSVAAVAILIPLGLWMTDLDYYDPWYVKGPDIHRALGVLFAIVLLLRLTVRLTQQRPVPLTSSPAQAAGVRWVHRLLYLLPGLLVMSVV